MNRNWKLRWKQVDNSTQLSAINFDPKNRPRRQDWDGELVETGMFYFMRRDLVEKDGLLQNDRFDIGIFNTYKYFLEYFTWEFCNFRLYSIF